MLKRIIELLFGAKLPCNHARFRAKPGNRVKCPHCGLKYIFARFEEGVTK
jgi:hypothetical protein